MRRKKRQCRVGMKFCEKLKDWITIVDRWLSDPEDDTQLELWLQSAEQLADGFEFSEREQYYIDRIVDMYEEKWKKKITVAAVPALPVEKHLLDELLSRKQTEQRTAEWYEQMSTILSASELGNLFGSERQRAKFVVSKSLPPVPRFQPLAVPSDRMSPFDWGIRFEPVVKLIYEHKYGVTLKELGRLKHPVDPRCSASPDGLVYHCPLRQRTGRLIEIKCPVTRELDGSIPKDYYAQMQMQLHVTGLKQCDYVEAVFSSRYNQMPTKEGPSLYDGFIAVLRTEEPVQGQDFHYVYSPVNPSMEWKPDTEEEVIEIIPWRLYQWEEKLVQRNEDWWVSIQPMMEAFWADVEKAKRGEFEVPDSTRPAKKAKTEKCMIQFHKLDEDGQPFSSPQGPVGEERKDSPPSFPLPQDNRMVEFPYLDHAAK